MVPLLRLNCKGRCAGFLANCLGGRGHSKSVSQLEDKVDDNLRPLENSGNKLNKLGMLGSWSSPKCRSGEATLLGKVFILGHVFEKKGIHLSNDRLNEFGFSRVGLAKRTEETNAQHYRRGLSSVQCQRYISNNFTIHITQQITKQDVDELQSDDLNSLIKQKSECHSNTEARFWQEDELIEDGEVEYMSNCDVEILKHHETTLAPLAPIDTSKGMEIWWHIPDSIEELLPLPTDFDDRMQVLFDKFGNSIDSRELLLRVVVHKSYYDSKLPAAIKEQVYLKPLTGRYINAGQEEGPQVEGLPHEEIPCMTFSEAHREVRAQLAILGDAVLSLTVSSLLVRQHSSAGNITERKCQLVSNNNLSRGWQTLLGPQDFVLCSSGVPSSQLAGSWGQNRILADTCEAYIGALYVEKGFETAFNCINQVLLPVLVQADPIRNPVSALNMQSTIAFQLLPEYRLIGVDNENTPHQVCRVRVYVKGIRMATGMGKNQKLARIDAARKALEKWPRVFIHPQIG